MEQSLIWGKKSPRMNLIREGIEGKDTINAYSNLECNNLLDTQLAKQLRFIIKKDLKGIFHLGSVGMMTQEAFFEAFIDGLSGKSEILKSTLFKIETGAFIEKNLKSKLLCVHSYQSWYNICRKFVN